jgi:hypothetical protein
MLQSTAMKITLITSIFVLHNLQTVQRTHSSVDTNGMIPTVMNVNIVHRGGLRTAMVLILMVLNALLIVRVMPSWVMEPIGSWARLPRLVQVDQINQHIPERVIMSQIIIGVV